MPSFRLTDVAAARLDVLSFFLMAYLGFSVPVIFTGVLADRYGAPAALLAFGLLLGLGACLVALGVVRALPSVRAALSSS